MKLALGVILGGAMFMGCAENAPKSKAPSDVMEQLHAELARTIGTTTLTSATFVKPAAPGAVNPPYLSIEAEQAAAPQTWGAAAPPSEQDDLAQNPYEKDLYDPR